MKHPELMPSSPEFAGKWMQERGVVSLTWESAAQMLDAYAAENIELEDNNDPEAKPILQTILRDDLYSSFINEVIA